MSSATSGKRFHEARFDPTSTPDEVILESLDRARIFDPQDRFLALNYLSSFKTYFTEGRSFELIDYQNDILEILKTKNRCGVVAFRSGGKTEFSAESFATRYAMAFPDSLILVACESAKMAKARLRNVKRQIIGQRMLLRSGVRNPFYNFYKYAIEWNKEAIILPNGSRIEVSGSATGVRGGREGDERYNLIIVDDPVPEQAGKDEAIMSWFRESIANLGQAGTVIILIGTPRRYGDIIVDLLENHEEMRFPLVYVPVAEQYPPISLEQVAWRERWNFESSCCHEEESPCALELGELERILAHMDDQRVFIGSLAWSREYMCEPIADGTAVFPHSLLSKRLDNETALESRAYEQSVRVIGVDPAANNEAAFVVLEIETVKRKYNAYEGYRARVLDVEYLDGKKYQDDFQTVQLETILRLWKTYDVNAIGIESNNYQATYKNLLEKREGRKLPIYLIHTGVNKHDLEVGLPSIRQWLENGFLTFPNKDEGQTRRKIQRMFDEFRGYQFDGGKVVYNGVAHGDIPMAFLKAKEVYHLFMSSGFKVIGSVDNRRNRRSNIKHERSNYYGY